MRYLFVAFNIMILSLGAWGSGGCGGGTAAGEDAASDADTETTDDSEAPTLTTFIDTFDRAELESCFNLPDPAVVRVTNVYENEDATFDPTETTEIMFLGTDGSVTTQFIGNDFQEVFAIDASGVNCKIVYTDRNQEEIDDVDASLTDQIVIKCVPQPDEPVLGEIQAGSCSEIWIQVVD